MTAAPHPRRYLWTDAFAVVTWVGLHEVTVEARYLDLAARLVTQVHDVLGVSRDAEHPTARGLRIGKRLPERAPGERYDAELEWERDGQYFHYLTKWMYALERMAHATNDERYRRWAIELAQAAHRAFVHPLGMYWKMSIDLSRPLVKTMGAHDPLEGLVEYSSLGLEREAQEMLKMCQGRDWATDDALGAGGLLVIALRLARLRQPLLGKVVSDLEASLPRAASTIRGPAASRLPFRELGFSLGLQAVEPLAEYVEVNGLRRHVLAAQIEDYWREIENQRSPTWTGHRDINAVTLAASLAPFGALGWPAES